MKLSIIVAVYNHEKYIEQTINSILEQKIACTYEVLIGEDCSSDNSRLVLKEIEKKCPANFHFIYREKNLGSEKNFVDLYSRMRGEYFIVIEGDDYWIDSAKIQQQIDFLETHREYIACAHNVLVVNEKSDIIPIDYPECKKNEYTIWDYSQFVLPGQTASIMSRNYFLDQSIDKSILEVPYYAGDRRRAFFLLANGKIYCFQQKWSAYRYVTSGGQSFSANIKESGVTRYQDLIFYKTLLEYSNKIKKKDFQKVCEAMYILALYGAFCFKADGITIEKIFHEYAKCHHKIFIISYLVRYKLEKRKQKNATCR